MRQPAADAPFARFTVYILPRGACKTVGDDVRRIQAPERIGMRPMNSLRGCARARHSVSAVFACNLPRRARSDAPAFRHGRTRRSNRNFCTWQLLKHKQAEIWWLAHDPDMGGLMAVCQDRRALDKRRARVRHDGAQGTARPTVFGQGRTLRSVRNYLSLVTSSPTGF